MTEHNCLMNSHQVKLHIIYIYLFLLWSITSANHSSIFRMVTVVCCDVGALGQAVLIPSTLDIIKQNRAGTRTKGSIGEGYSTCIDRA